MGKTMITYGRSREDVILWPGNPAAQQALGEYLDALPRGSGKIVHLFAGRDLDFTGADLSGLDLTDADFSDANLTGVRLVGASLAGAWLMGTTLREADLSQCNLRKAQGRNCDAQSTIFRDAVLDRAEFEDADFRRASIAGAQFFSAWFPGTDLRGADLRDCTFGQGSRFTSFDEARLGGCRLERAAGRVHGPIDVGMDSPRLLDGADLQRWFTDQGAPQVEVWQPAAP